MDLGARGVMERGEGKIATGGFRSNMAFVRRVISFLFACNVVLP